MQPKARLSKSYSCLAKLNTVRITQQNDIVNVISLHEKELICKANILLNLDGWRKESRTYKLKNKHKSNGNTNGVKKVIHLHQNYIALVPIKCTKAASS